MATSDTNFQSATLSAGGVLTLTGSPTGSGVYTVAKHAGASAPQTITGITGGSGGAMITLKPAVAGDIALVDSATFVLRQSQAWVPASLYDRMTLRDETGAGTVWVEEIARGTF